MKTHYCKADKAVISYEGECNWCGEKENNNGDKGEFEGSIKTAVKSNTKFSNDGRCDDDNVVES